MNKHQHYPLSNIYSQHVSPKIFAKTFTVSNRVECHLKLESTVLFLHQKYNRGNHVWKWVLLWKVSQLQWRSRELEPTVQQQSPHCWPWRSLCWLPRWLCLQELSQSLGGCLVLSLPVWQILAVMMNDEQDEKPEVQNPPRTNWWAGLWVCVYRGLHAS